jgi:hypothetical protein
MEQNLEGNKRTNGTKQVRNEVRKYNTEEPLYEKLKARML